MEWSQYKKNSAEKFIPPFLLSRMLIISPGPYVFLSSNKYFKENLLDRQKLYNIIIHKSELGEGNILWYGTRETEKKLDGKGVGVWEWR